MLYEYGFCSQHYGAVGKNWETTKKIHDWVNNFVYIISYISVLFYLVTYPQSRVSSVTIVTVPRFHAPILGKDKMFCLLKNVHSSSRLQPASYARAFEAVWKIKLVVYFPRSRKNGAIPPFFSTHSWHAERQLYLLPILFAQLFRIWRQQSPHVTVDSPICKCLHSNPK
jgi:hypothetical protein